MTSHPTGPSSTPAVLCGTPNRRALGVSLKPGSKLDVCALSCWTPADPRKYCSLCTEPRDSLRRPSACCPSLHGSAGPVAWQLQRDCGPLSCTHAESGTRSLSAAFPFLSQAGRCSWLSYGGRSRGSERVMTLPKPSQGREAQDGAAGSELSPGPPTRLPSVVSFLGPEAATGSGGDRSGRLVGCWPLPPVHMGSGQGWAACARTATRLPLILRPSCPLLAVTGAGSAVVPGEAAFQTRAAGPSEGRTAEARDRLHPPVCSSRSGRTHSPGGGL